MRQYKLDSTHTTSSIIIDGAAKLMRIDRKSSPKNSETLCAAVSRQLPLLSNLGITKLDGSFGLMFFSPRSSGYIIDGMKSLIEREEQEKK